MFTLEIATGNDAFATGTGVGAEVARILRDLADNVEERSDDAEGLLRDYNGAKVGSWRLEVQC